MPPVSSSPATGSAARVVLRLGAHAVRVSLADNATSRALAALAVCYDDLGQSVPPPGLIRIGTVETGLDEIAEVGGRIAARLERANEFR